MKEPNFLILSEEQLYQNGHFATIGDGYFSTIEVIKEKLLVVVEFKLGEVLVIYTKKKISQTEIININIKGLNFERSAFITKEDYRDQKINEILS